MARQPNGSEKKNNFIAKIWDETAQDYKPIYQAPDATNSVQGDVLLSDAVDSELSANNGMTAATPKAVKTVQDNANNKLDKVKTEKQTVASEVAFSKNVSAPHFIGSLTGNADSASTANKLTTPREIKLRGKVLGQANFDGSANIDILTNLGTNQVESGHVSFNYAGSNEKGGGANTLRTYDIINGSADWNSFTETGMYPVSMDRLAGQNVPTGAYGYGMLFVLKDELGDIIQQYISHSTTGEAWFRMKFHNSEFRAWKRVVFDGHNIPNNAVITSSIKDGAVTPEKVNFNYAGSASKGGSATTAEKLSFVSLTNEDLDNIKEVGKFYKGDSDNTVGHKPTGINNFGMIVMQIAGGWIAQIMYASDAALYTRHYNGTSWTAWKKIGTDIADRSIEGRKLKEHTVTSTEIANEGVAISNLKSDIGIVQTSSTQPTDPHCMIWIQP